LLRKHIKSLSWETLKLLWDACVIVFMLWFLHDAVDSDGNRVAHQLYQLVGLKSLLVSCGIVAAHISRKRIFHHIDLSTETNWAKIVGIFAWYIAIVAYYARGG
jgi:hypothetical protein